MKFPLSTSVLYGAFPMLLLLYFWWKLKSSRRVYSFQNKNVLITGGAGGLGTIMAKYIKEKGGNIILWDIDEERLKQAAEPTGASWYVVDLTDYNSVKETVTKTLEDHGQVDVLINNAGLVIGNSILDVDPKKVDKLLTVNVASHIWTLQGFLPKMIERGEGRIVSIASVMSMFGAQKLGPYCASKSAAALLNECLRLELKKYQGIKTTTIMPWHISTPMFKGLDFPWYVKFTTPTLTPEYVAHNVVDAVEKENEVVIMPKSFGAVFLSRFFLPLSWYDWIGNKLGSGTAMNKFAGERKKLLE